MKRMRKIYGQLILFIILIVFIVQILTMSYYSVEDEGGITALEGKVVADAVAKEWNSTSRIFFIETYSHYDGQLDGMFDWWIYYYTNYTVWDTYLEEQPEYYEHLIVQVYENMTYTIRDRAYGSFFPGYFYNNPHDFLEEYYIMDSDEIMEYADTNEDFREWHRNNRGAGVTHMELRPFRESNRVWVNDTHWTFETDEPYWVLDYSINYWGIFPTPDDLSGTSGSVSINATDGHAFSGGGYGSEPRQVCCASFVGIIALLVGVQTIKEYRQIHDKKFNPRNLERLDRPERHERTDFNRLISQLELEGLDIADIGAGTGFFSLPFAEKARKVYAVDISPEMLDYLFEKLKGQGITNIMTVLSEEGSIGLPDDSVDLAWMSSVFHELEGQGTIKEVHRMLKSGGRLAIMEHKKVEEDRGPPMRHRVSKQEAILMCSNLGFNFSGEFDPGTSRKYGLIFTK